LSHISIITISVPHTGQRVNKFNIRQRCVTVRILARGAAWRRCAARLPL